jgi:hypothetical protein
VDVDQRSAARRSCHGQQAARDCANLDIEVTHSLGEEPSASSDERLPHAATGEPANQQLRLPLTASIAARRIDVNDPRCHRP